MNVLDFLFDFSATMIAIAAPVALLARWFDRQSDGIERLDGSADALWPTVREEVDPPRWRVELLDDRPARAVEPSTRQSFSARRPPLELAR
jgi:hypothetical protein